LKQKPRYVSAYRDRHGVLRWRFRQAGLPESQTKELFGSEAWWAWYDLAARATPKPVASARTQPGSIHALGVAFYASSNYTRLRPGTQKTYKGIFDRYRDKYGDRPVAMLEAHHIRAQMDGMVDTPAAANNMLKVLRAVLRFAVERGMIRNDPTIGVRPLRYRSEGFHTWTEDEVARFEERWPIGSKQRLGFDLLLYTAQRSGDVRQMTIHQIAGDRVIVRQDKTGQPVDIPQHPRLQTSLASQKLGHLVILIAKDGKPYTEKGFGNWIKKAAVSAGLPHCSAHGLRKAAARRLAEAGCSPHEIMSITGHQSLKEVERYTREANRRGLADGAMKRIG
jgi:integrase